MRVLFLLASLLMTAPAGAQTGTIEGAVRDADGAPLPGATVQVVGTDFGAAAAEDGRFRLSSVPSGAQTIEARFLGLAPVRQAVAVLDGETVQLDFVLRDAAVTIGDVTVTGAREQGYRASTALQVNRSSAPIKETPFSIQVVTEDLIEDRGATQFGEALRYVPALTPRVGFSANNDRYHIRGFSTSYTYRNGFRRSGYSVGDQVANIEQVEILKGATSSLYGQAEPGGVVNVVTKRPEAEPFVEVIGSVGSFESYRATLDANVPVTPTLGVRLNTSYEDRDGYRDLTFARDFFVAPVVEWRPTPRTSLVVEGEYGVLRSFPDRGYGSDPRFLDAPRARQFAGDDGELARDGGLVTGILTHGLSDAVALRAAASYSEFTIEALYYGFGFPALGEGANPDVTLRPTDSFDNQNNLTVQVEAIGRFASGPARHTALLGVERGEDRWAYVFDQAPAVVVPFDDPTVPVPAQGPFELFFEGRSDNTFTAAYAQNETVLGPVRLLVGARYDQSRIYTEFGGITEKEEGQLSPRAGITWTPAPELSLYASAARSFVPQAFPLQGGGVSDAIRGTGLEAGAKFSLLGGRLAPTVAVFEITRANVAQVAPDDPTFSLYVLVGESRSRGMEVDAPLAITPRWRAVATYAYLDAEVTEDTSLEPGTPLINAPDHSAGLWTSYDVPGTLDGLTLGAGVLHIGERAATSTGDLLIPAYTRLDASASRLRDHVRSRPCPAQRAQPHRRVLLRVGRGELPAAPPGRAARVPVGPGGDAMTMTMHVRLADFVGLLAAGLVLAACGPADQEAPAGRAAPVHEAAGTSIPMAHATTFSVTDLGDGVRVVDLRAAVTSWGGSADGPEQRARIALVPREAEVPPLTGPLAGATVVRTPVQRVAVNYVPFEAMLTALGVADRLVAVGGTFSYDDAIHARVRSGELRQVGYGWHSPPAIDVLAAAEADVFLMALADLTHAEAIPRIEALGTPVVPMFMGAEPHYLGQVDYVRLVGMLTGREAEADAFVTKVTAEVDRLKALAATQPQKSLLWAWHSSGDRWGTTVRNADARLLRDANAELLMRQPDDARLDAMAWLSTEHLLTEATGADCWVIQDSHSQPYRNEAVLRHFRAWREGCVYAATGRSKPRRNAYEIYEDGMIRPDYLLGDVVKMLHPEVRPEPFRYLVPIGPEPVSTP